MTETSTGEPRATDQQISWLVETYGQLLFRVAMAIVRVRELAEDVVQDVLVKAWLAMPSWEGDVPIKWARVVTRNTALSLIRYENARPHEVLDDADPGGPSTPGVDEEWLRDERVREMWAVLEHLPDDARLLLVLHEVDGLSYDEIAETMDLSVSAVKSKIYRARQTLKNEIES